MQIQVLLVALTLATAANAVKKIWGEPEERIRIMAEAMSEAKLSAQLRDEAQKAEKIKKPVTAQDLINKGFKKPSERAIKQGKARLLMEDMVHRAERKLEELRRKNKAVTVSDEEIAEMLADELYHTPGTLLIKEEIEKMYNESGCEDERMFNRKRCFRTPTVHKYRTSDGTCNNLKKPLQGASDTAFRRLIPSAYEDGIESLRGNAQAQDPDRFFTAPHPSARLASLTIVRDRVQFETPFSHLLMQFGQFLDHDMDLGPELEEVCEGCEFTAECEPIRVPKDDQTFGLGTLQNGSCLTFRRSIPVCSTPTAGSFVAREQINTLTSYIDGSMIYGSNMKQQRAVRSFTNGLLKVGPNIGDDKPSLPVAVDAMVACPGRDDCFLCGDVRCNEQISLTVMHTLWVREHNRIAEELKRLNPHWSDETLFQEARKIVGAIIQKIVYFDYLPKVLGPTFFKILIGDFISYDPNVDASVPNSFATAAYRYGHSLIRPTFERLRPNYSPLLPPLKLTEMFFNPPQYEASGGASPIARGWTTVNSRRMDEFLNSILTTQLFQTEHGPGMDLAALNIQRSRDHGLPIYGVWENFCLRQFPQLGAAMIENQLTFARIIQTFGDLDNTELFLGGLAEERLEDSLLGITFACIFGLTFKNVRDGDRFYFERPGVFTRKQRLQIFQSSFSRVICDNTNSMTIQPDAFLTNQSRGSCDDTNLIPQVSLNAWKEPICYVRINVQQGKKITSCSRVIRFGEKYETYSNLDTSPDECLPTLCPSPNFRVRFLAFSTPYSYSQCTFTTNGLFTSYGYSNSFFSRILRERDPDIHTSLSSCQQDTSPAITFTCRHLVSVAEDDPLQNPESSDYSGDVPEELAEFLKEDTEGSMEPSQNPSKNDQEQLDSAKVQDEDLLEELQAAMAKLN